METIAADFHTYPIVKLLLSISCASSFRLHPQYVAVCVCVEQREKTERYRETEGNIER